MASTRPRGRRRPCHAALHRAWLQRGGEGGRAASPLVPPVRLATRSTATSSDSLMAARQTFRPSLPSSRCPCSRCPTCCTPRSRARCRVRIPGVHAAAGCATPQWALGPPPRRPAHPAATSCPQWPLCLPPHAVFEPHYVAMFRDMLGEHPEGGQGARFVHVLSPAAAPPALLENAVGGLPRVGCYAEVQSIQVGLLRRRAELRRGVAFPAMLPAWRAAHPRRLRGMPPQDRADGTLAVQYEGARRVQLLLVQRQEPYAVVAGARRDGQCAVQCSGNQCPALLVTGRLAAPRLPPAPSSHLHLQPSTMMMWRWAIWTRQWMCWSGRRPGCCSRCACGECLARRRWAGPPACLPPQPACPAQHALRVLCPALRLQIQSLAAVVDPSGAAELPEAVARFCPPQVQKQTSYDALKAAGHRAAGHIETWRRHGSVYKSQRQPAAAAADPYEAIREALGKARRQELFSFAAAQLLVMGTPERAALLLRCGAAQAGGRDGWHKGRQPGLAHPTPLPGALFSQPGHWRAAQLCAGRAAPLPAGAAGHGQPAAGAGVTRPSRPRRSLPCTMPACTVVPPALVPPSPGPPSRCTMLC